MDVHAYHQTRKKKKRKKLKRKRKLKNPLSPPETTPAVWSFLYKKKRRPASQVISHVSKLYASVFVLTLHSSFDFGKEC